MWKREPQYTGLENLHQRFRARGLAVIGSPCNQFGGQEPGGADEIGAFCSRHHGVSFQMMDKIEVNGSAVHPLYKWMTAAAPGLFGSEAIKWNFTKFLVDKTGRVVARHGPQVKPEALAKDIEKLLAQS